MYRLQQSAFSSTLLDVNRLLLINYPVLIVQLWRWGEGEGRIKRRLMAPSARKRKPLGQAGNFPEAGGGGGRQRAREQSGRNQFVTAVRI